MHELQVYHVELEMQNEELRRAQQTLAEALVCARVGNGTRHLGLTSVRERAEQLQRKLTVTSRPGVRTTISVQIPLSPV